MRVSELVDLLSQQSGIDHKRVNAIARELINAGELPKAKGRAVPDVTMEHRAKLLLALATCDSITGCAEKMRLRFDAPSTEYGDPDSLTGGVFLMRNMEKIADYDFQTWSLWQKSRLYVNRSRPLLRFAFGEIQHRFGEAMDEVVFAHYESLDSPDHGEWKGSSALLIMASVSFEFITSAATGLTNIDATSAFLQKNKDLIEELKGLTQEEIAQRLSGQEE